MGRWRETPSPLSRGRGLDRVLGIAARGWEGGGGGKGREGKKEGVKEKLNKKRRKGEREPGP